MERPDLEGVLDSGKRVLCEVKTINRSDDDVRPGEQLRKASPQPAEGFFRKLDSNIAKAKSQVRVYDPDGDAKHLVYVNVRFDSPYFREDHRQQIDGHLQEHPPGVVVVFAPEGF